MVRGEVYWEDLAPRSGSEQSGRRPVVVVSADGFNLSAGWRTVIVVPLSTSAAPARRGPTVVEIAVGTAGLQRTSFAVCHQITTLDRGKLAKRIGILPPDVFDALNDALRATLDLD